LRGVDPGTERRSWILYRNRDYAEKAYGEIVLGLQMGLQKAYMDIDIGNHGRIRGELIPGYFVTTVYPLAPDDFPALLHYREGRGVFIGREAHLNFFAHVIRRLSRRQGEHSLGALTPFLGTSRPSGPVNVHDLSRRVAPFSVLNKDYVPAPLRLIDPETPGSPSVSGDYSFLGKGPSGKGGGNFRGLVVSHFPPPAPGQFVERAA